MIQPSSLGAADLILAVLLLLSLAAHARSAWIARRARATFEERVLVRTAAVELARSKLQAILDALPSMIGSWNAQGINRFANRAYLAHRGEPAADGFAGRPILEVLGEDLHGRVRPHIEAALRGERRIVELKLAKQDGSEPRHCVVHYIPEIAADGAVRGYFVAVNDVHELTESRLKLATVLRQHEALLHTMHVHSIVSVTDGAGLILDVNDSFCRISGYSRDELKGQTHGILRSGLHGAPFWDKMWRTLLAGIPWRGEICNRARDGSLHWADSVIAPLIGADGRIEKFIAIRTDITASKRLEAQLRDSNERFKIASDSAGIGVWEYDVSTNRLTWNDWMYRIYGLSPDSQDEPYSLWVASLHPEDRAGGMEQIAMALSGEKDFECEFRVVRPGGEIRCVKAAARVILGADGAPLKMTGVNIDITDNRRAQQTLVEASSLLRTVLDCTAEISIIATDASLTIRVFNAGAERLLGYRNVEVVGRVTPMMLHDAEELRTCGEELSAMLGVEVDPGAVYAHPSMLQRQREWTYMRKDGGRVTISMVVTAMHADDGELLGYVCVAHDVTRQNRYEESLRAATGKSEQANRAKSEFLANMSHEIRTPLNAIIGLGYLLEQTVLGEDQRQFLSKIQFAGRALLGVINNVLDLSKVEAGEMTLEIERFDLPELFRELGQMLSPQAHAKGIQLVLRTTPELPRIVQGDALRLRQILMNLMNNSIKFTSAGEVGVHVLCTEHSAEVIRLRCEVTDTGIGIEPAALAHLFTPFTQADASTTRRFGGTGLGLSIARRLVELMGGEIGVNSTVGVGSTFWIELPLQVADGTRGKAGMHPERGLRVCVFDSNGDAPGGLGPMVRALGWSPQVFDSGDRLLAVMSDTQPDSAADVMLVDLHDQNMDAAGYRLVARLIDECPGAALPPVIIVADDAKSHPLHPAFLRATDAVLIRPVTSSALFNAVNTAVWRRYDGHQRSLQIAHFDELNTRWLSGVRILVADDSEINLEVAQRILEKQGAIVSICSDGHAALEIVRTDHQVLDVVLMDVQMPVLDGNEATRRIRCELQLPQLPIIALTAGALVGERQRSLDAGMNEFISKPFDPQALIRKIRQVVERARGAPIAVVTHDVVRVASAVDISRMSSIDADMVQRTFGEDLSLFKTLLPRILRDFAEFALPVIVTPGDESLQLQLRQRTHKLKGSAGVIGAIHVMRFAAAAEEALLQGRSVELVEAIFQQLAGALTALGEEADGLLAGSPGGDAGHVTGHADRPAFVRRELEELLQLLDTQNIAAVARFDALSRALRECLGAGRFDGLKCAIDNLDFPPGAELLRSALSGGAFA
jgi:PAS domain S-box-containing protein